MGLAQRLEALERKARGKGYKVGPPKPEAPLPEGFTRDERGWLYYRMSAAEWDEVSTILGEAHRLAGHTGVVEFAAPADIAPIVIGAPSLTIPERAATGDDDDDDWEPPYEPEPPPERDQYGSPVVEYTPPPRRRNRVNPIEAERARARRKR